jgi:hypothetical protein
LCPVMRLYRAMISVAVYPSGCPTCNPAPLEMVWVFSVD